LVDSGTKTLEMHRFVKADTGKYQNNALSTESLNIERFSVSSRI